jgi:hypothetical protein
MKTTMKVICITIEDREKELTIAIAKRFPIIHPYSYRFDLAVTHKTKPETICRVTASSIDKDLHGWLILCDDILHGLHWESPFVPTKTEDIQKLDSRNVWYDVLEDIPIVVLL